MTTAAAFRGTVTATAVLVEATVVGEAEARRRVVCLWRPGVDVRRLPDGAWLVLLPHPVQVRAERAPGLPLAATGPDTRSPPGRQGGQGPGVIALERGGRPLELRIADLPAVSLAGWVRLGDVPVRTLRPLDPPVPAPASLGAPSAVAPPDLRAAAGIGRARRRAPAWPRPSRPHRRPRPPSPDADGGGAGARRAGRRGRPDRRPRRGDGGGTVVPAQGAHRPRADRSGQRPRPDHDGGHWPGWGCAARWLRWCVAGTSGTWPS